MGSCFSSGTKKRGSLSKPTPEEAPTPNPRAQRDPRPPEPDAEETVKEVLSETPRPRPTTRTRADQDQVANSKEVQIIDKSFAAAIPIPGVLPLPIDSSNGCDARSEDASEAWSLSAKSETLSASNTPAEKRRGAAAEAGRRASREERSPAKYQRKRSVSGEFAYRRDRSVAVGCGSGRPSPSPAGRRSEHAVVGRTNSAREAARSRAAGAGATRDPGERSGRRSVSPAAKRAVELRQSGGQGRAAAAARSNGMQQQQIPAAAEGGRRLCVQDEVVGGGGAAGSEGEAKESLENPLVSLECFIFL